ncbi:MAG: bifunctional N-acetylglucosamine-1-phosphate uridyltransferase/glucosamine-1-phosphate acetyltransferase [Candidatus Omnitrophica bacterium]|nr:bifunctional N-acetylglucosamine-1-phosphate uridyltransferase/glucosamine-1-phosphate acetyltransferase [Candidatus Omnitrophota bacterium]
MVMKNIIAVILAAGKGVRMKSNLSKVLHNLCGQPLIYYVLREVKKAGIKQVIAIVGQENEGIKRVVANSFQKIDFVQQKEPLGTAHALRQARGELKKEDDVLVLPGDVPLITADSLKRLISVHIKQNNSCTLISSYLPNPYSYGRIIRVNGKIIKIKEEKDASFDEKKIKEVNSGIYLFNSEHLFNALSRVLPANKKKEYYLTDVISLFTQQGLKIDSVSVPENEILGVNGRQDLSRAQKIMQGRVLERIFEKGVSIIDPATTYISEEVKVGSDTIIYPSTFIEGKINIGRGCRIGPFAHIRGDCSVGNNVVIGNFVEIVRCKIGTNCCIKHHSYLGDCLLEKDVNVGAGTITANYDGKRKSKTIVKQGAFIGSGTILVAPAKIGKEAITGAGSVVLKNKDVKNGEVVAGVPAQSIKKSK